MGVSALSFIEVENLSKQYKIIKKGKGILRPFFGNNYYYLQALKEITFKIEKNDIVGYIGPNGAGKSTTIKLLAGILQPDEGRCVIDGRVPWEARKEYVRTIGVMFGQKSQLLWDLPPIDTYEMLAGIYRINKTEYQKMLNLLCNLLDLDSLLYKPVRQMSLGQRMRCELAATFIHCPKIVFLDEPTLGIDIEGKKQFHSFIKTINKSLNVTFFITTHDLNDVESLCNRLIIINEGELYFNNTLERLYSEYAIGSKIYIKSEGQRLLNLPSYVAIDSVKDQVTVVNVDPSVDVGLAISEIAQSNSIYSIYAERPKIENIILAIYKEMRKA